jgi:hypothetical protein
VPVVGEERPPAVVRRRRRHGAECASRGTAPRALATPTAAYHHHP